MSIQGLLLISTFAGVLLRLLLVLRSLSREASFPQRPDEGLKYPNPSAFAPEFVLGTVTGCVLSGYLIGLSLSSPDVTVLRGVLCLVTTGFAFIGIWMGTLASRGDQIGFGKPGFIFGRVLFALLLGLAPVLAVVWLGKLIWA